MASFVLVPATEEHALDLAAHLSPQTIQDYQVLGLDPAQKLVYTLRTAVCAFAGVADGRCFCIFGVVPDSLVSDSGQVCLMTAAELPPCPIAMARATRQYLPYLRNRFTSLRGYVYEHNAVSIKWLRWLGYTVSTDTIALCGKSYRPFEWKEARG